MRAMKTVPTDIPVFLHMPDGSRFRGELHPFVDLNGDEVFGWVCLDEGQAPDDWTDDVCWASNENEQRSTRPVGWSPIKAEEAA